MLRKHHIDLKSKLDKYWKILILQEGSIKY